MIGHSDRKHAPLSASSSSRWINCPPSMRMEEQIGAEDSTSIFAEEGTLAHEFGDLDLKIQTYVGDVSETSDYTKWKREKEELKKHKLYKPEMDEYVAVYVDYVLEQYNEACKKTTGAELKIEERTDYSYLVPEGFGTSDANIVADEVLEIVDLKYGKGIKVESLGNSQLRLYALGILRKFDLIYNIKKVKMTIVQPRLYHIDSETLTVEELHKWAKQVVQPSAEQAHKGEGTCKAGSWCRWCKAKPICRALAEHNLELASKEFADPRTLEDSEVLEVFKQQNLLVDWVNSVSKYILDQALKGKHWPGYKLVEGRANRKWADEDKAIEALKGEGYEATQITNTKIKGIGEVEELTGKQVFNKLDLTIRPSGKPTLVEESDKRPAFGIEQAKKDFE